MLNLNINNSLLEEHVGSARNVPGDPNAPMVQNEVGSGAPTGVNCYG